MQALIKSAVSAITKSLVLNDINDIKNAITLVKQHCHEIGIISSITSCEITEAGCLSLAIIHENYPEYVETFVRLSGEYQHSHMFCVCATRNLILTDNMMDDDEYKRTIQTIEDTVRNRDIRGLQFILQELYLEYYPPEKCRQLMNHLKVTADVERLLTYRMRYPVRSPFAVFTLRT